MANERLFDYHLAFCVKRRRKILVDGLKIRTEELIREACRQLDVVVTDLQVFPEYVFMSVSAPPTYGPAVVTRLVKVSTAKTLRREFPEILKMPSLWTGAAYYSDDDPVDMDELREFIESQPKRDT